MRAGYFRVSDEDQIYGYSLDAQRRAFGEFCRQKGWEVGETYSEEGRSAWVESIGKRPAFRRMLEDAQARKFDLVVTHTLGSFLPEPQGDAGSLPYLRPERRDLRVHHPRNRLLKA